MAGMGGQDAATIVWITGATQGIGAALARSVPYPNSRVVNISRRVHPDLETVVADLTDPTSWDVVAAHVAAELSGFAGERAIFIHNANYGSATGFVGEIDPIEYRRQVLANAAGSLMLGDAFIRACRPGYESGLVMISSAAAKFAMQGHAVYGAAKAGMEQWVRGVRAERKRRGEGPWVVAIRPGFVVTDEMRAHAASYDDREFPGGAAVKAAIESGKGDSPEECARSIWGLLPPDPDGRTVLFLGEFVEGSQG
jgi:NAD(P)-dependent dehydrogenase (short-subunit alcohol dehydrogenase family)